MYTPRLPPAAFQETGLAKAAAAPYGGRVFAWLMEMGTRKTATTLIEWMRLVEAGLLSDLLVIAPSGCYRNWTEDGEDPSEARKHLDPALFERTIVGTWKSGAGKAHRDGLARLLSAPRDRPRVLAVNVEAIGRVKAARDLVGEFLARRRGMLVVDESPVIKTPDARQTETVLSFAELALYRRILSGLVTPNSPLDLFSQFQFLDWRILGQRSFYGFRNRYAIIKKMTFGGELRQGAGGVVERVDAPGARRVRTADIVVGYRNEEELQGRINPYSYRVLKEDVLKDLPPKVYMPLRYVEMTPEQERVYRELRQQATAQLDVGGWVSPQLPITLMLRLHQVLCGHVTDDEGVVRPVATNRVDALLDWQDQHPRGRKITVWAHYREAVEMVADRLRREFGPRAVAMFYGPNKSTRHEDEARFKGDPDCRFMVASQAAGGRGNNWQVSDFIVYYASTHNLDHRAQSEDRSHRDGQTLPVMVGDLVVPGTVDMKILHALREKINLAAVINGDNWRSWIV